MNLEHSPSINRIVVSEVRIKEIQDRKRLKDKRPSPGDHNPEKLDEHYKKYRLRPSLERTLRLYDKSILKEAFAKRHKSVVVSPGPHEYNPRLSKINNPGTFQKETAPRGVLKEDLGVSPHTYDTQRGLSMCSSLEKLSNAKGQQSFQLAPRIKGGVIGQTKRPIF